MTDPHETLKPSEKRPGIDAAHMRKRTSPAVIQVVLEAGRGGLEVMSADLALAVAARGIRSTVLGLDAAGEQRERLEAGGVEVIGLSGRKPADPRFFLRVLRALRANRADAVHTHMFAPLLYAAPTRMLAGIPVLVHTEHSIEYLLERPAYQNVLRNLARTATRFVVLGERMRRFYVEQIRIKPERVRVIPNGVTLLPVTADADRREARRALGLEEHFVVGTVGRLAPEKNFPLLLRAFSRAMGGKADAALVLIGDGQERTALAQLAVELGISNQVHFAGWRQDVARLLPALDVFALSSLAEGLPLALLEAMSAGVAVVSTSVGDIPEVISDSTTGRLVRSNDEDALANALVELRQQPSVRNHLADAGRALVYARYGRDAMVNAYLDAYGIVPPSTITS
jgi:glycosyltransferase involved in cell wall biosynthesis